MKYRGFCIFILVLKSKRSYFILLSSIVFACCVGPFARDKERSPQPVEFITTEHSPLFTEDLLKIELDTLKNVLILNLEFDKEGLKEFPYPKHQSGEILTGTCFNFSLFYNGQLLESANLTGKESIHNYFGYNKWLSKYLLFQSDSIDIKNNHHISFSIPFFALQKLKAGINQLDLKVCQDHFFSPNRFPKIYVDSLGDSTHHFIRNFSKTTLLSASIQFKVNMPKIFKTTVYGHGIALRNDSVYSPAGMDNTIWNSSYPDVYWTINFPQDDFYCSSDYQKSTSEYDAKDTFYIYHYTPYDTISIGVWDHDNLSRDDYISFDQFSLNQFKNGAITTFSFQNIKEFKLKVDRQGFVNK